MAKSYMKYVLAGALAVGLTLPLGFEARADHDYTAACHEKLQNQKAKIDHDAARYGNDSPKVNADVAKLENERAWCRDHHADWDHSVFDVGIYVHH